MIDDGRSKNGRNLADDLQGLSISDLANMLSISSDVDEALRVEGVICKKIDESSVSEISSLLTSNDRYCNIAALRILSDCSGFGITSVYKYVDSLFERNDLILNRLSLSLIEGFNYFEESARNRMAQFIEFPDVPTRRTIRVWLLFLSRNDLESFIKDNGPFSDNILKLLLLLMDFKEGKFDTREFLERIRGVDEVAFNEFTRLSKQKFGPPHHIFHTK